MKRILTVSGSSRRDSTNINLLKSLSAVDSERTYIHFDQLHEIPLFAAESDKHPWPEQVLSWRAAIEDADAVIISTPEYIHNIPAQIKSALEWIASSGELVGKPTLAMTYTPHAPRGQKAMQSLLWSLEALDANIVAQVPLYQNEIKVINNKLVGDEETIEMLTEVLRML